ncbi:MAG: flagellar biosynthetic protein FliO [Firmicutes bacterium]|nr:flagellar biosynthetic protein FliO [Bacillota bacterium]
MDSFLAFVRVTGSLLLVVILAYYTLRYLMPFLQRGNLYARRNLEILERLSVAPRMALCLIRAGNRYFLIGLTPTKITYLQEISADELELPEKKTIGGFAEILRAQKAKFPFSRQQGDDDD